MDAKDEIKDAIESTELQSVSDPSVVWSLDGTEVDVVDRDGRNGRTECVAVVDAENRQIMRGSGRDLLELLESLGFEPQE